MRTSIPFARYFLFMCPKKLSTSKRLLLVLSKMQLFASFSDGAGKAQASLFLMVVGKTFSTTKLDYS